MRVELSRDGDVAVAVESFYELLALVPEVRLCGEVGRCLLLLAVGGRRWRRGC